MFARDTLSCVFGHICCNELFKINGTRVFFFYMASSYHNLCKIENINSMFFFFFYPSFPVELTLY